MTSRTRRGRAGVVVALAVMALTSCTATPAASTSPTVTAPATAPSGGLLAEDPPHDVVQTFPPAGTCHARTVPGGVLPDAGCTPGAVDPHVTADTIDTTVCRPGGYTDSVRPPVSVTTPEKRAALAAYGNPGPASITEFDHLVPLALGGSPNSPANLWPEPGASPNPKDTLENALRDLLCAHRIDLAVAQRMIAADWVAAYRQILGHDPTG